MENTTQLPGDIISELFVMLSTFLIQTALTGENLYPYGPQQNDEEFGFNDTSSYWRCPEIRIDQFGLPFFTERYYKLYVGILPYTATQRICCNHGANASRVIITTKITLTFFKRS